MTISRLKPALRALVREYGLGTVLKSLGEIADVKRGEVQKRDRRRKPRLTATEYVEKMALPGEKADVVTELAERFENKEFLPTFRSLVEFCRTYDIEAPASTSRVGAIPRIFRFMSDMEVVEIKRIRDEGVFSGPSKLRPISDAIRNYSRTTAN